MLDRQSLNVPNAITVGRLVLAVVLFVLIELGVDGLLLATLFVLTALTDLLDGWIARRWNLITPLGRVLDPFADKFVVCGTLFFLLPRANSGVTAWMVTAIVARELFVSALRGLLERKGIDFSADWSGKIKSFVQFVAVTAALLTLDPRFAAPPYPLVRDVLLWLAVGVTLYSWVAYVVRGVTLLAAANSGD
jgi:CDP-diacylglycerol---glycerol-3-phosphate 3-phosphatidyltransferase